jgi:hypothetical protein
VKRVRPCAWCGPNSPAVCRVFADGEVCWACAKCRDIDPTAVYFPPPRSRHVPAADLLAHGAATLASLARRVGVKPNTLTRRLARGATLARAIEPAGRRGPPVRCILHNGATRPLDEIAAAGGVHPRTLRKALAKGESIEALFARVAAWKSARAGAAPAPPR